MTNGIIDRIEKERKERVIADAEALEHKKHATSQRRIALQSYLDKDLTPTEAELCAKLDFCNEIEKWVLLNPLKYEKMPKIAHSGSLEYDIDILAFAIHFRNQVYKAEIEQDHDIKVKKLTMLAHKELGANMTNELIKAMKIKIPFAFRSALEHPHKKFNGIYRLSHTDRQILS